MTDRLVIDIVAEDHATAVMENVQEAFSDVTKEAEKSTKAAQENADAQAEVAKAAGESKTGLEVLGGSLKGATAAFGQIGLAIDGVKQIYETYTQTVEILTRAYREQLEAERQIVQAIVFRGRSQQAANREAQEAARAIQQSGNLIFASLSDQTRAYGELVKSLGDSQKAHTALDTAVKLSAISGREIQTTTEAVTEATRGNIQALIDLGVVTERESRALLALSEDADRARFAMALLENATKNADQALTEAQKKSRETGAAFRGLWSNLGEATSSAQRLVGSFLSLGEESRALSTGATATGAAVKGLSLAFDEAAKGADVLISTWWRTGDVFEAVQKAHQRIGERNKEIAEDAAKASEAAAEEEKERIRILKEAEAEAAAEAAMRDKFRASMLMLEVNVIKAKTNEARILAQKELEINQILHAGLAPREEAARLLIAEERAAAALAQIEKQKASVSSDNRARVQSLRDEIALMKETGELAKIELRLQQETARISAMKTSRAEKNLLLEKATLQAAADRNVLLQRAVDQMREQAKAAQEQADATARAERVLRVDQERLKIEMARVELGRETDRQKRLEIQISLEALELQKSSIEFENAKLEIMNQEIGAAEKEALIASARMEMEIRNLQILESTRAAAHDAEIARIEKERTEQQRTFDIFQNAFAGVGGKFGAAAGGLTSQISSVTQKFQEMIDAGEGSEKALAGSMSAGAGAVSGFMAEMGVGYEIVAGIRAAFEAASAVAAYATGNIPGGIAHTLAASMFGAMAGGAGAPSTAPAVSADAGGSGGSAQALEKGMMAQKQAYLEALKEAAASQEQRTTVIDMRYGNFYERDPVSSRNVQRTLAFDNRLTLGN